MKNDRVIDFVLGHHLNLEFIEVVYSMHIRRTSNCPNCLIAHVLRRDPNECPELGRSMEMLIMHVYRYTLLNQHFTVPCSSVDWHAGRVCSLSAGL